MEGKETETEQKAARRILGSVIDFIFVSWSPFFCMQIEHGHFQGRKLKS